MEDFEEQQRSQRQLEEMLRQFVIKAIGKAIKDGKSFLKMNVAIILDFDGDNKE